MLNLDPKYLSLVRKILADHVPNKTVWAYGSRVKGTAHAGSDLDLVVVETKEDLLPETLSSLQAAFSESDLPITVDILNWSDIPDAFKEEIKIRELL